MYLGFYVSADISIDKNNVDSIHSLNDFHEFISLSPMNIINYSHFSKHLTVCDCHAFAEQLLQVHQLCQVQVCIGV